MRHLVIKLLLIVVIVAGCIVATVPPKEKIRLGKDLRGGVSLIYRVDVPEDSPRETVISQTIEVLKDRINPKGVLDISIAPLGLDRIEIVMPLPNEEVRARQRAYQASLESLLRSAQILPAELEEALRTGTAAARYCGSAQRGAEEAGGAAGQRCGDVASLQEAYQRMVDARRALGEARGTEATEQTMAELEDGVAQAELEYHRLFDAVAVTSLDRGRLVRTLGLSQERKVRRDDRGRPLLDEQGEPQMEPSPREADLERLQREYPHVAGEVTALVAAYDEYQNKRSGLDDPEDLKRLLRGAGVLEYYITVSPTAPEGVNVEELRQQLVQGGPHSVDSTVAQWFPLNELKQWYDDPQQLAALERDPRSFFQARNYVVDYYQGEYYMLLYNRSGKRMTHQDGEWSIENTYRTVDQLGRRAVAFQLDSPGGALMGRLTGAHVGEPMAIVLDGEVYSAPVLQSQISSNGIITGTFSEAEISYLIRVLAAGALGARLSPEPMAVNVLGPTLGADNLKRGRQAFILSLLATAGFMLIYYFFAGFVADVALLANAIIIFGVMSMIQGMFTLPGLAGIVLTIGMAVDANVLIYERIREEMFAGEQDLRAMIRVGYSKALSTIVDANVTNLIVCVVLFYTATAEVKGFAYTFTIGILATLFTALFVTRTIFALYTDVFRCRRLPMLATVVPAIHRALEPSVRWIALRRIFIPLSLIAIVGSLVLVKVRGTDLLDTEFRGGVTAAMVTRPTGDAAAAGGESVPRLWMAQSEVAERVREMGRKADPLAAADPEERERQTILRELRNAVVLTSGDTRLDEQGRVVATEFQFKVANPAGLASEDAVTGTIVNAIVETFRDEIDVSPALSFAGDDQEQAAEHVHEIDSRDLGPIVGDPSLSVNVGDYLGGVAIEVRQIDPPVPLADIEQRIEALRNQPDFSRSAGRQTRVVGWTSAGPGRTGERFSDVVVLVSDPAVNSLKVGSDVWYEELAQPEWALVSTALQRQSSLQQVTSFSSAVAQTLAANAVVAVLLSLLGILVYIWVRFGSLRYSAAAVVALVHDVIISLGALALSALVAKTVFGRDVLLIEEFRIDMGVVAALLTIIGYSLNDTIVIMDRIRENRGKRLVPTAAIIDNSINQTLSRTVLTGGTTLIATIIMFIEGGSGIRPFTYVLIAGLIVGTYSSVAIAAPIVWRRRDESHPGSPAEASTSAAEPQPAGAG
jgi:SecD/SecF fusion protein